jgi:uncharacterized protein YcnI
MSHLTSSTRLRRAAAMSAAGLVAATAILVFAAPAGAHVTVHPSSAPKGSEQELTFRVPNEEDQAAVDKLEVYFPPVTVAPVAEVEVEPHPGWTATVTNTPLTKPIKTDDGEVSEAATEVAWTADTPADGIQPGQYDDFNISAGPLPSNVGSMTFKALQYYSNGDIVRWIETRAPGGPVPDHPAPVLTLTTGGAVPTPSSSATLVDQGSTNSGLWFAVAALALSLATVVAVVVLSVRRRPDTR